MKALEQTSDDAKIILLVGLVWLVTSVLFGLLAPDMPDAARVWRGGGLLFLLLLTAVLYSEFRGRGHPSDTASPSAAGGANVNTDDKEDNLGKMEDVKQSKQV